MRIDFEPIGTIHTPFKNIEDMPIQPSAAKGIKGHIELQEKYVEGLMDLEEFSHIYLLYYFHLVKTFHLKVIPFLGDQEHGLFATRTPKRPNPIGLSLVKLVGVQANILHIENVDIVDGTPLLDIKPYVGEMESVSDYRIGWLSSYKDKLKSHQSDDRFK